MSVAQKLLVVGGNGFLGSAICKLAVGKGWEVTSLSSSGKPFTTPAGHQPAWTERVHWQKGSAFDPSSYASLLGDSTAVIHTLGILLEDANYKERIKGGDIFGTVKAVLGSSSAPNPLRGDVDRQRGYEGMNRDSAITVLRTMLAEQSKSGPSRRPFIYVSATDAFSPLVPKRYIESKREAEREIAKLSTPAIRDVFLRPGLMYHPHLRPLTTLPAFMLSITSQLPRPPSNLFRTSTNPIAKSLKAITTSLSTPALHVDHVAAAALKSVEDDSIRGVVGVREMRRWAGMGSDYDVQEAITV